ncbi:MAG TPA: hypothetical protein VMW75_08650 [Thermoanaerobaculia bacterium]|nr:hypothetical protein [Thermoanaerobaculia bacterium]
MNRKIFSIALLAFVALARMGSALAQCAIQETPAATLLLPYFEVDLSTGYGKNTQVTVGNAFYNPVLVEAVVWSDLGVPIFSFDIYLNGYQDVQLDLRTILEYGTLPQTAPPAGSYPSCQGFLPPAQISWSNLAIYQAALTGQQAQPGPGPGYFCAGRNLGDTIARGYVTFDTANSCTLRVPSDVGFFAAGGQGDYSNNNTLYGDFAYVNSSTSQAEGHPLVHMVADASATQLSVSGYYTFYGKFDSWTAVDNREPLATEFAARYVPAGTDLIVWRDSKVNQGWFNCNSLPTWYPLGQEGLWDMADSGTYSSLNNLKPFGAVAQRVHVGGSSLPVPYSSGWLYMDLNTYVAAAGNNPPVDDSVSQAWVLTSSTLNGDATIGNPAIRYDSACRPRHYGP